MHTYTYIVSTVIFNNLSERIWLDKQKMQKVICEQVESKKRIPPQHDDIN